MKFSRLDTDEWPYIILCAAVFVVMVFHALAGNWSGDFWEHAAAVRELSLHPLGPLHPILLSEAPHVFFTPYHLALAAISRFSGIQPITTLALAGLFNLIVFLAALRQLILVWFDNRRTVFYAIILILFLWGPAPWDFSGFFHFGVLGLVLPYPSTIATALVFFGLAQATLYLRSKESWRLGILFLMSSFVLITHPLSALVFFVGLLALTLSAENPTPVSIRSFQLLSIIPMSIVAAFFWPYYPFDQLFFLENVSVHAANVQMYEEPLKKIFPSLLAIPLVLERLKNKKRDPLVFFLLGLSAIYFYGALSQQWSYGRIISSIVLILQIVLADWLSRFESRFVKGPAVIPWFCALVFVAFLLTFNNFSEAWRRCRPEPTKRYQKYEFISQHVQPYEVVLTDLETGWYIPAFSGKLVASQSVLPFINDQEIRKAAVEEFFDGKTLAEERQATIEEYGVDYILVNQKKLKTEVSVFESFGETVYQDDNFLLIKLK